MEGYPPTTFVVMERDGSLERAERNVELFGKSGVPSGVVVVSFCLVCSAWMWRGKEGRELESWGHSLALRPLTLPSS